MENRRFIAMSYNLLMLMGHNNHGAIFALLEQLGIAFSVKSAITNRHDLINQKTIEIDCQRECKCKACPHS